MCTFRFGMAVIIVTIVRIVPGMLTISLQPTTDNTEKSVRAHLFSVGKRSSKELKVFDNEMNGFWYGIKILRLHALSTVSAGHKF